MNRLKTAATAGLAIAMFATGALVLTARSGSTAGPGLASARAPGLQDAEVASAADVDATIATLEERVRAGGENPLELATLGSAYLEKARSTGDPAFYRLAGEALGRSLAERPNFLPAVLGMGELSLARHAFSEALSWGDKAFELNPYSSTALGVVGDAYVELGRYDQAFDAYQRMVDLRPNLSSFARVSYARELVGDVRGAIDAMKRAEMAGAFVAENEAWTANQLGDLYFGAGEFSTARQQYRRALQRAGDFTPALAGLGRVEAATGDIDSAIRRYERVVRLLPFPQYVATLGDLYLVSGRRADARAQYRVVLAQQRLLRADGVFPDVEMTIFLADHGRTATALKQARAQHAERASIRTADALAWALYRQGSFEEAARFARASLNLGTRDAMLHFHAGMIDIQLGRTVTASRHLHRALQINPEFSILYAPDARRALQDLEEK